MRGSGNVSIKRSNYRLVLLVAYLTVIFMTPLFWFHWITLQAYVGIGLLAAVVVFSAKYIKPEGNDG